jgi:predicted PurR-regulated permease PerM
MIANNVNKKHIIEIIEKIKRDIKAYFVIKTIVSLITSSASYILMTSF